MFFGRITFGLGIDGRESGTDYASGGSFSFIERYAAGRTDVPIVFYIVMTLRTHQFAGWSFAIGALSPVHSLRSPALGAFVY